MEPFGRSEIRRQILEQFLGRSDFESHPREVARIIQRAAPPVVRELRALEDRRILTSTRMGPLRRYRAAGTREAAAARAALFGMPSASDRDGHDGRLLRLHSRIADRLQRDPDFVMAKAHQNLARWEQLDPTGNAPWIQAWTKILAGGPAATALAVVDPGEVMRELRQSSPFAGVLSVQERLQVIRDVESTGAAR